MEWEWETGLPGVGDSAARSGRQGCQEWETGLPGEEDRAARRGRQGCQEWETGLTEAGHRADRSWRQVDSVTSLEQSLAGKHYAIGHSIIHDNW